MSSNQDTSINLAIDYGAIVDTMRNQLYAMCSLDSMEKDVLDNFVSSACEFDAILGHRGDLRLMFTIPDDTSSHSPQIFAPIVSKLFIAAVYRRRVTSSF